MSRVRAYLIGRHVRCDYPIDAEGVAERHAEAIALADGGYHITDCGSPGGTFVLRDSQWQPIQQAFVARGEQLRFGDFEIDVDALDVLREPPSGRRNPARGGVLTQARVGAPNAEQGLVRDPQTGEILERPHR